jgi:hypothetical protein
MNFLRRLLALTVLAAVCVVSGAAYAGDDSNLAEARRLYNEAKKAMTEKRYKDAATAFEGASNIKAHAVALYTAAQAWELASEPARAADAYARALSTPQLSDSQAKRSGERLEDLQKQLGVVVVSGKDGTRVRLDDHSEFEVPAKLHGKPGSHELAITRADGSTETKKVDLSAGATAEVDAEAKPEPEAKEEEPEKEVKLSEPAKHPVEVSTSEGPWKTIGYVTLGAGVAALAGGALLGMSAKDAEDTYKNSPTRATYDHAKGLESKTNIMFIAGGVLTAGGVGLLIWGGPKKSKEKAVDTALRIEVGPTELVAKGRF